VPLGLSFNGSLWSRRQLQNGRLLALTQSCQERDPHLLTGGGGGLMKAVGQAFLKKKRDILDSTDSQEI